MVFPFLQERKREDNDRLHSTDDTTVFGSAFS